MRGKSKKLFPAICATSAMRGTFDWRIRTILFLGFAGIVGIVPGSSRADEDRARKTPIGNFITITSPIDDSIAARVSTAAIKLQSQSAQEDRPAYLVLQIEPGTSQFHHVQGLAKFLTSAQISDVTTVAWIPQTVTGSNVVVALACRQIVMHPDAELGDIGRGKPMDPDDQQAVLAIAQKRHNPRVNTAIARGMMDQNEQLWKVRIKSGNPDKPDLESRVVTRDELKTIRKSNITIEGVEVVKEPGILGTFRGSTARTMDILVSQTADSRSAVGDLYNLPREALREQTLEKESKRVRMVKVDGIIDTLQESFLTRQIHRAVAEGAQVIVFEIDSPGGYLDTSFNLAETIAKLEDQKIRTIAYIPDAAISGAAIISLGCDEIIMHPNARIGDAGPIELRAGGPFERAPEKIVSLMRVMLSDLAVKKHRPPALCMAMADRSSKVFQVTHRDNGRIWYMSEADVKATGDEWILGHQLPETNGELLFTVNGQRAHDLKLAEPPVHDASELNLRIGLPATVVLKPIEKTWVDGLVFWLNSPRMTVFLVLLGAALIFIEQHFMTGILGILSVLCFALFFWSRFLGGTAGWLEVVLFVLGIACLALEIFVIPGFGVFGLSGIAMIIASLVMAGHSWTFDLTMNLEGLATQTGWVLLSFVLLGALMFGMAQYLPQTKMFESMVLGPPGGALEDEPQLLLNHAADREHPKGSSLGKKGVAITMLRPAGKAVLDNRIVNVVSEGPFIMPDAPIEVIAVTGNKIVVRQA